MLKASATFADGRSHTFAAGLQGLDPRRFDVVRKTASSVTLGYPSRTSPFRRDGGRRCSTITYRLAAQAGHLDVLHRARELLPRADGEGIWSSDLDPDNSQGDNRSKTTWAWRTYGSIERDDYATDDGVAVYHEAGTDLDTRPAATISLSLRARAIRASRPCAVGFSYTTGPGVLRPLTPG